MSQTRSLAVQALVTALEKLEREHKQLQESHDALRLAFESQAQENAELQAQLQKIQKASNMPQSMKNTAPKSPYIDMGALQPAPSLPSFNNLSQYRNEQVDSVGEPAADFVPMSGVQQQKKSGAKSQSSGASAHQVAKITSDEDAILVQAFQDSIKSCRQAPKVQSFVKKQLPVTPLGVRKRQMSSRGNRRIRKRVVNTMKTHINIDSGISLGLASRCRRDSVSQLMFEWKGKPFDRNGILYYIGKSISKGKGYVNPHKQPGGVVVSSSPLFSGNGSCLKRFVEHVWPKEMRAGIRNCTSDMPNSYFCIDFGQSKRVKVSHYCLRSDKNGSIGAIRTWLLQGSHDFKNWVTLSKHKNDSTMPRRSFAVGSWPVASISKAPKSCKLRSEQCADAFRYLRVMQIGQTAGGLNQLMIAGVEFYGTLHLHKAAVQHMSIDVKEKENAISC